MKERKFSKIDLIDPMSDALYDSFSRQKMSSSHQMTTYYDLLAWLDTIPLSRPIHNLEKDFSDGVLVAEIIAYFFPEYVDLEKYSNARNMSQRTKNWRRLNADVLPKLSLHAPGTVVHDITNGDHRAVELFLLHLREKLEDHLIHTGRKSRLHWETWRSYNVERYRLPPLLGTPRRNPVYPPVVPFNGYQPYYNHHGRYLDPILFQYDETNKFKDEQVELLRGKLKQYERLMQTKDRKIQQLEEKIEKMKSLRTTQ